MIPPIPEGGLAAGQSAAQIVASLEMGAADPSVLVDGSPEQEAYMEALKQDLARSLGVEPHEIDIVGLNAGSGGAAAPKGCDNVAGSGKVLDECLVCDGDNRTCADCANVTNGDAVTDRCGVCNVNSDCVLDCIGVWGGGGAVDQCGICLGNGVCRKPVVAELALPAPASPAGYATDAAKNTLCTAIAGQLGLDGEVAADGSHPHVAVTSVSAGTPGGVILNLQILAPPDETASGRRLQSLLSILSSLAGAVAAAAGLDESVFSLEALEAVFDCKGQVNGPAVNDACHVCGGDNSTCADCAGRPNGGAVTDRCGICDSNRTNDCVLDCNGVWSGGAVVDVCGVCGGIATEGAQCSAVSAISVEFSINSADSSAALAKLNDQLSDPDSELWNGAVTGGLTPGQTTSISAACPAGYIPNGRLLCSLPNFPHFQNVHTVWPHLRHSCCL